MGSRLAKINDFFHLRYMVLILIFSVLFTGCISSIGLNKEINKIDADGKTLLYLAIDREDTQAVKELIEDGADVNLIAENEYSPLILACQKGNFEIIKLLIENGADINYQMGDNTYALYQLVGYQDLDSKKDYLAMVKYMVENGADYRKDGFNNYSLLHASKDIKITKYLIELGMDIHALSKNNATTLIGSVANNGSGTEITEYLIEHCVDLNATAKFNGRELNAYEMGIKSNRLKSANIIKKAMSNPPKHCIETNVIPPIVEFYNLPQIYDANSGSITINVRAQGSGIGNTYLIVNGAEFVNSDSNGTNIKKFSVKLLEGINIIQAYAYDMENKEKSQIINNNFVYKINRDPAMHAIIIGTGELKESSKLLETTLNERAKELFSSVNITYLNEDESTTNTAILEQIKSLKNVAKSDIFVLYSSSLKLLEQDNKSAEELKNAIENIPAMKKLLLFDTNKSSLINEKIVKQLVEKQDENLSIAAILAINDMDIDSSQTDGNRLFVNMLIKGLSGDADANKDRYVNSIELVNYISEFNLTNNIKDKLSLLNFNTGKEFNIAKTKDENFKIGRFEFLVSDESIFINIKDPVKQHFRFTNMNGEYKIVIDFDSDVYTQHTIKDLQSSKFVNVKVGYHRDFYRIAVQTRDKVKYDLKTKDDGIEIILREK